MSSSPNRTENPVQNIRYDDLLVAHTDTACERHASHERLSCKRQPAIAAIVLTALLSLWLGVLVYITARAPGTTAFLPVSWNIAIPWPPVALILAGSLPTFFHTLGFCLLLSLLAGASRRTTWWVCTIWFAIEIAFEVGQIPRFSSFIVEHLPSWFSHIGLLDHLGPYFVAGVFDPLDLLAALTGAILALTSMTAITPEKRQRHE